MSLLIPYLVVASDFCDRALLKHMRREPQCLIRHVTKVPSSVRLLNGWENVIRQRLMVAHAVASESYNKQDCLHGIELVQGSKGAPIYDISD